MSKRKPKAEAAIPTPAPPKRDPTSHEAAAMAKAVAYSQTRTDPIRYKVMGIEGRNATVEPPHNQIAGFVALQGATFGTVSNDFASQTAAEAFDIVRSRGQPHDPLAGCGLAEGH